MKKQIIGAIVGIGTSAALLAGLKKFTDDRKAKKKYVEYIQQVNETVKEKEADENEENNG